MLKQMEAGVCQEYSMAHILSTPRWLYAYKHVYIYMYIGPQFVKRAWLALMFEFGVIFGGVHGLSSART